MIWNVFAVYDQYFTWDPIESEGMYVCCGQDTLDACMTHQEKYNQSNWQKVASFRKPLVMLGKNAAGLVSFSCRKTA